MTKTTHRSIYTHMYIYTIQALIIRPKHTRTIKPKCSPYVQPLGKDLYESRAQGIGPKKLSKSAHP